MSQIATLPNTILRPPSLASIKARGAGAQAEQTYIDWLLSEYGSSIVALWRQDDMGSVAFDASPNGFHGVHVGATPVQSDIPWAADRPVAMQYDGATRYTNVYSAALAAAFNAVTLTFGGWMKVRAGSVWSDAAVRTLAVVGADANNQIVPFKSSVANTVNLRTVIGGTTKTVSITISTLNWFQVIITVDTTASIMKGYLNGVQSGSDQTTIGTWAGALASDRCVIGAASLIPVQATDGYLAHWFLCNVAHPAATIARIYAKGIQHMGGM